MYILNIKPLDAEQTFMKEVFDDIDQKSNLLKNAQIIEWTLEAFGLFVRIEEIDIQPDVYIYSVKPKKEDYINDICKHNKDLAMALSIPTNILEITVPVQGNNIVRICIPRINTIGLQVQEARSIGLCKPIIGVQRQVGNKLLQLSKNIFRWYEGNYRLYDINYAIIDSYRRRFRRVSNEELMKLFNSECDEPNWSERSIYLTALQMEFDKRKLDYSGIASINTGLSFNKRIKLINKMVVYEHT